MSIKQIFSQYKKGLLSIEDLKIKLALLKNARNKKRLSEGQQGLWALQKINPEITAYNCPFCFKFSQEVNIVLFEKACQLLVKQYPVLQTVLREEDGQVYQVVDSSEPVCIETGDLSQFESDQILSLLKGKAKEPFSFEKGHLFRIHLLKRSEQETLVLLSVHHLIFDGSSVLPLLTTLFSFYQDLLIGKTPSLHSLSKGYQDFVLAEKAMIKSKEGERRLSYWKEQLKGSLHPLEFPVDVPRLPRQSFQGATCHYKMDAELTSQIRQFSADNSSYLSTLFLAVFKLLLHRYSRQEDITVGMAFDERGPDYQSLIGFFINMIPIRSRIPQETSFLSFLNKLQHAMAEGLAHSYPFPALLRALHIPFSSSHSPIFQVGFLYQNFSGSQELNHLTNQYQDLSFEIIEGICQEGEYEISLEVFEQETQFALNLKYDPNLYKETTIQRFLEHYCNLFKKLIQAPTESPVKHSFLSETEKKLVVSDWNTTQQWYPEACCFHDLFSEQVEKTPNAVAVRYDGDVLTYRDLDEKSAILATYLQLKGVKPNQLVALCIDRSLDMLIGLLAIQKSGGAYVPLDPGYPAKRLRYMLEDSKAKIILTQAKIRKSLEKVITSANKTKEERLIVSFDEQWEEIRKAGQRRKLKKQARPTDLVYVIYTSGSTGNPKGVMISHGSLVNFLCSMKDLLGIQAKDRFLAVTTYCFDIAGLELYLPLLVGAECKISSVEEQKEPEKLISTLRHYKPTMMQATPVTWKLLFEAGWKNEHRLKILCGGETLPIGLQHAFHQTGCESWNLFGPTETTIWSTVQKITDESAVSIGRPIANTQVYVVDSSKQLAAIGVVGELWIGGVGVAQGYWNRPELTKEKFVTNPFSEDPTSRVYKTGDLARWLPNGTIDCLGRMDQQVKLHGFRIELGEIENSLNTHPDIEQAIVVLQENPIVRLIAYYIPSSTLQQPEISGQLQAFLQDQLPPHMIPSLFLPIQRFPLTPNGKLDRKYLAQQKIERVKETQQNATQPIIRSELEETILSLWKDVLQIEDIGVHDRLFEVGGNSILVVALARKIQEAMGCEFLPATLFKHNTVYSISQYLTKNGASQQEKLTPVSSVQVKQSPENASHYPEYYKDSLAIIGISCHFPGASGHQQFWQNLRQGKESIRFLSKEDLKEYSLPQDIIDDPNYIAIQSRIEGKELFDPSFFNISPSNAKLMDPQFRLLLLHAWQAIEDAGYVTDTLTRAGVFISAANYFYTTLSSKFLSANQVTQNSDEYVAWLLAQGGTIPTMISYQLGLEGQSVFVHSNCSSSLSALHTAYQSLQLKEVNYALVGAANLSASLNLGYIHQPGLNFSSDGHCKVFDANADGMIGGEGVGVILIKRAMDAIEDNDHIYALIRGIAVNNDGSDKAGFYAPSVKGQSSVIKQVLEKTQIHPDSIGYVEAHGTGTALGDPIELMALSEAYNQHTTQKQFCGIGSVKSNIGHLDTVAGLAGCIKVALSLYHGELPPSINYTTPNPQIDFENSPFYVTQQLEQWTQENSPRRAALSSFGIGGTNTHAILEEYKTQPKQKNQHSTTDTIAPYLIPLSAKKEHNLQEYAQKFIAFLESWQGQSKEQEKEQLQRLAYTLQTGREAMEHRVIFIVLNTEELIVQLQAFREVSNQGPYFTGTYRSRQNDIELLEGDEDAKQLIQQWIQKRKLKKLAKLWVNGANIDWKLLYNKKMPTRMSLPSYPFSKEKYWIDHFEKFVPTKKNKPQVEALNCTELQEQTSSILISNSPSVSLYDCGKGIFLIQISESKIQTTLSQILIEELLQAFTKIKKQTQVKVLILSSTDSWFLVGGRTQQNEVVKQQLHLEIASFPFPIIAAVKGNATGAGFLIAALCDFMICSQEHQYYYTSLQDALFPTQKEELLFIERFGEIQAQAFLFSACKFTGKQLQEKRWSCPILPSDQVDSYAQELATILAGMPQESLRQLKQHLSRHIRTCANELKPADFHFSIKKLQEGHHKHVTCSSPLIQLETYEENVLVVKICPLEHDLKLESLILALENVFSQVSDSTQYESMVLVSSDPGFLPMEEAQIRRLQNLFLGAKIPVIAALDGNARNNAWLISLFCDDCIYNENGRYCYDSAAKEAVEIFSLRFGAYLAKEIIFTGAEYTGQELRERLGTLRVAPTDQVLSTALQLANSLPNLPRNWKQRIQEKLAKLPAWKEQKIETSHHLPNTPTDISLNSKVIKVTVHPQGILVVKMEDREAKNMFSQAFVTGIIEVFQHIEKTPVYKVVVLTGYDTYFASGGTKEGLLAIGEGKVKFTDAKIYQLAMECSIPVISAMQGHGIGAGWSLGMFADLILFSKESRYISPYMNYGFTPGAGSTLIFPHQMGHDLGREILLTAKEYEGSEFRDRGVLMPVLPRKQIYESAITLAQKIARIPRSTLVAFKQQFAQKLSNQLEETYQLELEMHEQTFVNNSQTLSKIQQNFIQDTAISAIPVEQGEDFVTENSLNEPISSSIGSTLKQLLAKELHIKEEEIQEDIQFIDLGLDSITGVTWTRKINQQYEIKIPATKIYNYPTLSELTKYVRKEVEKKETLTIRAASNVTSHNTAQLPSLKKDIPSFQGNSKSGKIHKTVSLKKTPAIAVIGMAGKFPQAKNLEEFWENIESGKNCISEVPKCRWDIEKYYSTDSKLPESTNCKWMGSIEEYDRFDPLFFNISPREAEAMDPQQRLFLETCWHSVEDSGYNPKSLSGSKCGVFVGCATNDYGKLLHDSGLTAQAFTGSAISILAARTSYFLNLQGPCLSIDTSCSSSLVAISTACDSLASCDSDLALAGGVFVMAGPSLHIMASKAGMLSQDGQCFTFDQRANGFVPGEGVGVVFLKRLGDAQKDRDPIYGVIRGWGVNQDGKTNGLTAPNPESQARLQQEVYSKYKINPEEIQLIEAHGTGTKLGDPIEIEGLQNSFQKYTKRKKYCGLGSIKSNIGHLAAAAGVAGVIKILLALQHKKLPPSINFKQLNKHIDLENSPFYVITECKEWSAPTGNRLQAAINSFGFSGTNAHMVISESPNGSVNLHSPPNTPVIITLSAKTQSQLRKHVQSLLKALEKNPDFLVVNLAYTLQIGRQSMNHRLAVITDSHETLKQNLVKYIQGKSDPNILYAEIGEKDGQSTNIHEGRDYIQKLVENRQYKTLAELWINGNDIDWSGLYNLETVQRLSGLPGYTFARERYWVRQQNGGKDHLSNVKKSSSSMVSTVLHENTSDLSEQQFIPRFSGQQNQKKVDLSLPTMISEFGSSTKKPQAIKLRSLPGVEAVNIEPTVKKPDRIKTTVPEQALQKQSNENLAKIPLETIEEQLISSLAKELYMKESDIDPKKQFIDMGLDSVVGVEWIQAVNEEFKTNITVTTIYDYPSIKSLACFLQEECYKNVQPCLKLSKSSIPSRDHHDKTRPPSNPSKFGKIKSSISLFEDTPSKRASLMESKRSAKELKKQWSQLGTQYGFVLSNVTSSLDSFEFRPWIPPKPEPHDVTIQVMASAINFPDIMCVKGLYPTMPNYPFVPGFEVAGVISAVGRQVTQFQIGDPVIALTGHVMGGHASFVNTPARNVAKKPSCLTFEEACSFPIVFGTVDYAFELGKLSAHESVLIQTATGGCGLMALQLAALAGAVSFATTSRQQKADILTRLEVPYILNYRSDFDQEIDQITQSRGVDVVLNMLSGDAIQKGINCLAPSGRYLEIAVHALKTSPKLDLSRLIKNQSFYSIDLRRLGFEESPLSLPKMFSKMNALIESKRIVPIVSRIYPIYQMVDALNYVAQGNHIGKVVMSHTADTMTDLKESCIQNLLVQKKKATEKTSRTLPISFGKKNDNNSIAIVGRSGQFPKSDNLEEYWKNIAEGNDCISEIPADRWSIGEYYHEEAVEGKTNCKWMGVLENADKFDPSFFNISPAEAEWMDPQQRVFLQNAWSCIEDAGINPETLSSSRCGVFVGCGMGDYGQSARGEGLASKHMMGASSSILSARISYFLDLKGPCLSIDTACSSSLVAIVEACTSLNNHTSDLALAGGVCVLPGPTMHIMTSHAGMLSKDGRCFTFDNRANGFVPGEGVGVLLLRRLEDAFQEKDPICGIIRGWGINQDGKTNGITAPSVNSQIMLEKEVYQRFAIHPETISLVEAHGTGTKLGDPIEVEGLIKSFKSQTSKKQSCALGSIKSNIGHLLPAAGVAGVIKVLLSLQHRKLVPSANFQTLNPHISLENSPFFINIELQDWKSPPSGPRRACISSFGFSGTNAHLVIEEAPSPLLSTELMPTSLSKIPLFVPISAKNKEQLRVHIKQLNLFLQKVTQEQEKTLSIEDIAYTLQVGRSAMEERVVFMVKDLSDLLKKLQSFLDNQKSIKNCYQGSIKRKEERIAELLMDEDMAQTIALWVEKKKYSKLMNLWITGLTIDWNQLYGEVKPNRIRLPTYPFAKERYWVSERKIQRASSSVSNKGNGEFDENGFSNIIDQLSDNIIDMDQAVTALTFKIQDKC